MTELNLSTRPYTVRNFVSWQKDKTLVLSPNFQRRAVWKPDAKSYFIDSIARGYPVPLIFVREKISLDSTDFGMEVVDGQQRLRTLFSFIDPGLLKDFNPRRDSFTVAKYHNADIADRSFSELSTTVRNQILGYMLNVYVLPHTVEDSQILGIFARLNSTGVRLTGQELRNARYFGPFKLLMYRLALEQLDKWREWRVFTEDQIARMAEVELVSDLSQNIIHGLSGKRQTTLNTLYNDYNLGLQGADELAKRFRSIMRTIDDLLGGRIRRTVFSSQVNFFTLFVYLYDRTYGLGSSLTAETKPKRLSPVIGKRLLALSQAIAKEDVPAEVLDATRRASADLGRRRTRLRFMAERCDG